MPNHRHPDYSLRRKYPQEYNSWRAMIARCTDENYHHYHRYGGRGIKVCERWTTFANFVQDMKRKPTAKHTIERKNSNKGYCKENCVWATHTTQMRNTIRNVMIEIDGVIKPMPEWSEISGIPLYVIGKRLRRGWSGNRAVYTPVKSMNVGKLLSAFGKKKTLSAWCKEYNQPVTRISMRINNYGMPLEEALLKS